MAAARSKSKRPKAANQKPRPARRATDDPNIVSAARLSAIFGVTDRWLRDLADRGVIAKVGHGKYRLADSVQGYIRFIRESEAKAAADTPTKSDYDFERARKVKLENDEKERKLTDTDLAIAAVDLIVGMLRTDLAGVPSRISEDVAMRRRAEDAIDTVLSGLTRRLAKARDALRQGRDPGEADETDNA